MLQCPKCEHQNRDGTFCCDNCFWLLDESDTVYIPEETRQEIVEAYHTYHVPQQETRLPPQTLLLSIEPGVEPIILLPSDKPYLIGRNLSTQSYHNINLSPYNADLLGVSRRHAVLYSTIDGWLVEDLGSTNGTYVNENQLDTKESHIVRRGDLLQFGLLIAQVEIESSAVIVAMNQ
jgi:pSer/pThr/pTyr-binding forkhead associated (FHA) protein